MNAHYRLRKLQGWARRLAVPFRVRRVSGPARPALEPEDVSAVVLVRDGGDQVEPFLRHCFALGNRAASDAIRFHEGGLRKSLFGVDAFLTKHPLLRRASGARPSITSSHYCHGARVADVSCLLRHYKFDRGFPRRCREAVRRGSHFGRSQEYRAYVRWLDSGPDPALPTDRCRWLESADQLVGEGFLAVSADYLAYVRAPAGG